MYSCILSFIFTIMPYREFIVRGEGYEKVHGSTRDRPRFGLSAPIQINKYHLKTVEIPLTFQPLVDNSVYTFYTTYYLDDGSNFVFTNNFTFTQEELLTGDLLLEKLETILDLHASQDVAAHLADATITITNNGAPTDTRLNAATYARINTTTPTELSPTPVGAPYIYVGRALVAGTGVTNCTSVEINLGQGSLLGDLFDFTYLSTGIITLTNDGAGFNSSDATEPPLPIMRTRPSYLLLHSNLRAGAYHYSTGRPGDTGSTVLCKIPIRMDSTQPWGEVTQIWTNGSLHPDLMFTANDALYSELEFWFTYPDGTTKVCFGGKAFSLTLACIVNNPV